MKIQAIANIDDNIIKCTGEIEIHWIKEPQAYITWRLSNNDKLIASKSENYFYKKNSSADELLNRILKKIENYKIGRNKIFEKVKIL